MMLCTTIAPASKLQMEMPYAKKVGIVAAAHRTTRPPTCATGHVAPLQRVA